MKVVEVVFGFGVKLIKFEVVKMMKEVGILMGKEVVVFGCNWGKEF